MCDNAKMMRNLVRQFHLCTRIAYTWGKVSTVEKFFCFSLIRAYLLTRRLARARGERRFGDLDRGAVAFGDRAEKSVASWASMGESGRVL